MSRMRSIDDEGDEYRRKNKNCRIRDAMLSSLVNKHRKGILSDMEYFNSVVEVNKDYDLPYGQQTES